jgi:16S rRNA processing protein RimM
MDRVSVGRIVSTRGIRGELRLMPAARDFGRFAELRRVFVEGVEGPEAGFRVLRAWQHRGAVVLQLEGIESIEQAERLVGCEALVPLAEAVRLAEDEYFVHDLVGLSVHTDGGREVGVLAEVLEGPGNDIYVVRGPAGETLVPAVGDIVLAVDLQGRTMLIHDLPGLLEPEPPV